MALSEVCSQRYRAKTMKKLLQNKALVIIFILAVLGLVAALLMRSSATPVLEGQGEKITVNQNGSEVTVYENGAVIRRHADGSLEHEVWSLEKTAAFFEYYSRLYQAQEVGGQELEGVDFVQIGGNRYPISGSDELSDIIIDPNGQDGGGSSGDDSGGDDNLDDFFDDDDDDSGGGSGDGGGGGSNGGQDQQEEECLFWRLSYCVTFPTPTPVPSPTPTPGPDFEALPPTCEELLNQETGRTVISNELCVAEPTATPTPNP